METRQSVRERRSRAFFIGNERSLYLSDGNELKLPGFGLGVRIRPVHDNFGVLQVHLDTEGFGSNDLSIK